MFVSGTQSGAEWEGRKAGGGAPCDLSEGCLPLLLPDRLFALPQFHREAQAGVPTARGQAHPLRPPASLWASDPGMLAHWGGRGLLTQSQGLEVCFSRQFSVTPGGWTRAGLGSSRSRSFTHSHAPGQHLEAGGAGCSTLTLCKSIVYTLLGSQCPLSFLFPALF